MGNVNGRARAETEIVADADEMPVGPDDRSGAEPGAPPQLQPAKQRHIHAAADGRRSQPGHDAVIGQNQRGLWLQEFAGHDVYVPGFAGGARCLAGGGEKRRGRDRAGGLPAEWHEG